MFLPDRVSNRKLHMELLCIESHLGGDYQRMLSVCSKVQFTNVKK